MRVLFVIFFCCFFFFKQKTAYEMRISDWSSDVCSSDLPIGKAAELVGRTPAAIREAEKDGRLPPPPRTENNRRVGYTLAQLNDMRGLFGTRPWRAADDPCRSEEHTSELQSLMRTQYAVLCLKKKNVSSIT